MPADLTVCWKRSFQQYRPDCSSALLFSDDGFAICAALPIGFVFGRNLPPPVRTGTTLGSGVFSLLRLVSHDLLFRHLLTNVQMRLPNGAKRNWDSLHLACSAVSGSSVLWLVWRGAVDHALRRLQLHRSQVLEERLRIPLGLSGYLVFDPPEFFNDLILH